MNTFNLGIIGCGNMANAIVSGATSTKFILPNQIFALAHNKTKDQKFAKQHRIKFLADIESLFETCTVILLAVKPKSMMDLLNQIKPHIKNHLIITVAAGLKIKTYQKHLGKTVKIIRAMPNTPSFISLGVTALCYSKTTSKQDQILARDLFDSIGSTYELKSESQMDAATALSGSGPAFIFSYIDAIIKAAKANGLPEIMATNVLLDTMLGSTLYMKHSQKTAKELITQVASKGGTTEQGLAVLHKKGFAKILDECFKATRKKSQQMD